MRMRSRVIVSSYPSSPADAIAESATTIARVGIVSVAASRRNCGGVGPGGKGGIVVGVGKARIDESHFAAASAPGDAFAATTTVTVLSIANESASVSSIDAGAGITACGSGSGVTATTGAGSGVGCTTAGGCGQAVAMRTVAPRSQGAWRGERMGERKVLGGMAVR